MTGDLYENGITGVRVLNPNDTFEYEHFKNGEYVPF